MTGGSVRRVQTSLRQAADAQIAKVVAMVDAMPDRGEADSLIAPLRPRLAELRLPRPFNFARFLFTPLNPVIYATAEWQRCGMGIPRPGIMPIADAVQSALPADASWEGLRVDCSGVGATLWPDAAAVLDRLSMPTDWPTRSGLSMRHFDMVTTCAAAVLREATAIERMANQHGPLNEDTLRALLTRSKARGTMALDTIVAVLLARLPSPARSLALAADVSGVDRATEQMLGRIVAKLTTQAEGTNDPREVAAELSRLCNLLRDLDTGTLERRRQLEAVRREADSVYRRSFGRAVEQTLAMAQAAAIASDDESVSAMEASARNLRRLNLAGWELGSSLPHAAVLAATTAAIKGQAGQLSLTDRVRIVEILDGPDAAMALLDAG